MGTAGSLKEVAGMPESEELCVVLCTVTFKGREGQLPVLERFV